MFSVWFSKIPVCLTLVQAGKHTLTYYKPIINHLVWTELQGSNILEGGRGVASQSALSDQVYSPGLWSKLYALLHGLYLQRAPQHYIFTGHLIPTSYFQDYSPLPSNVDLLQEFK